MTQMNLSNFSNRLKSLFNIDGYMLPELSDTQIERFFENPVKFFITCDDKTQALIWQLIHKRCTPYDK